MKFWGETLFSENFGDTTESLGSEPLIQISGTQVPQQFCFFGFLPVH